MNGFSIKCIVLKREVIIPTKDGSVVVHWRVADPSATIVLVTFGDKGQMLEPGDMLHLTMAYTDVHREKMNLYYNKTKGNMVKYGEFMMAANYEVDMSERKDEHAKFAAEK